MRVRLEKEKEREKERKRGRNALNHPSPPQPTNRIMRFPARQFDRCRQAEVYGGQRHFGLKTERKKRHCGCELHYRVVCQPPCLSFFI